MLIVGEANAVITARGQRIDDVAVDACGVVRAGDLAQLPQVQACLARAAEDRTSRQRQIIQVLTSAAEDRGRHPARCRQIGQHANTVISRDVEDARIRWNGLVDDPRIALSATPTAEPFGISACGNGILAEECHAEAGRVLCAPFATRAVKHRLRRSLEIKTARQGFFR